MEAFTFTNTCNKDMIYEGKLMYDGESTSNWKTTKLKYEVEDSGHFLNIYIVPTLKIQSDVLVGTTIKQWFVNKTPNQ